MKISTLSAVIIVTVTLKIAAQQSTPIDLRLNSITATAREAFAIKADVAANRAKSGNEITPIISDLKEQLRKRKARIDDDIADLKKILFADL